MDPEKIYKSLIENSSLEPPSDIWEGIQDQLDIDMVWSGIDRSLTSYTPQSNWVRIVAVAASLLIIVSAGAILLYNTGKPEAEPTVTELQQQERVRSHSEPLPGETVPWQEREVTNSEQPPGEAVPWQEREVTNSEQPLLAVNEAITAAAYREPVVAAGSDGYDDIVNMRDVFRPEPSRIDIVLTDSARGNLSGFSFPEPTSYLSDAGSKQAVRSLYVGVTGQLANTWMVNHKTVEALKPDDLTAVNASYGRNIGIHAGTNIGQAIRLRSDFMWLSQSRQSYNEYINGKYVTSNYELNYYTLSLQAGYGFINEGREHFIWAGSYVGFMRGAIRELPGIATDIRDEYSDLDYGVMAGYDYPVQVGYGVTITPGISFKYGLANVFRGNDYIPWYLGQTRNAAVNFSLSVSYNLF